MRGKPSIDAFMEGGREKETPLTSQGKPTTHPNDESDKRTKKLFELRESLVIKVERRCTDERARQGRRVTQREVVEALLEKWVSGEIVI